MLKTLKISLNESVEQQKALVEGRSGAPSSKQGHSTSYHCCSHQNPYLHREDTFSRRQQFPARGDSPPRHRIGYRKQQGVMQQAPSSGSCAEDGGKAGRWIEHPKPLLHVPASSRLRLTTECAPWDQVSSDEEGAQLLHQLRVRDAAPPPQGVPVQQGDVLGHEEAPIACEAGEEGPLEVDSPCTSPCADVLHGGAAETPQSLPGP